MIVYTSIVGGKDLLREDQARGNARYLAFLEVPQPSSTWEVLPAYDRFKSARRNSRAPKILAHQFIDADVSIWIDGNFRLVLPPEELVARYLKNADLAVMKHPLRDCIYDAADFCAEQRLDDPVVLHRQAQHYLALGYPRHMGLCACGLIIRRHTRAVAQFNDAWWSEYCRHSVRDQISFMFVARQTALNFAVIEAPRTFRDGKEYKSDFVEVVRHLTPQPEPMGGPAPASADGEAPTP